MANTNSSTITVQTLIDYVRSAYEKATATVGVAGYDLEPGLSYANDIIQKVMNKNNPWKWNSYLFPTFYTQPYQQDYPTSISQNTMGWLEDATMIGINNNSLPLPQPPIRCVARLLATSATGDPSEICWIPNRKAILGVWPGAGVTYQSPLTVNGVGGPGSNPLTAILDPNGNIQVVTQYGVTGGGPSWPAASASAGTVTNDGSVQWTVQDPNGVALRVNFLATYGSYVWQINAVYQEKPPLLTTLSQTFAPIPDDLGYLIKQGFLVYCYKKSEPKLFAQEYAQWIQDVKEAMEASDREPQEFGMYPSEPITGSGGLGAYSYPGWPGWTNMGN